jgi:hypothetical protein
MGINVDKRYELYCLADRLFYDSPDSEVRGDAAFQVAARPLPGGWRQLRKGEWLVYVPPANSLPGQGWKVHVSACRDNADEVLAAVWDYCTRRRISFKHLRSRLTLHMRNAKYAPRGGSGKLVTIYPAGEGELEVILAELGALLDGQPGPYILSDLRVGNGPLYVRYGGFAERYCDDGTGELVPAIEDAAGRLVPDQRRPSFHVPDWVTLPSFLQPHLAARNEVSLAGLPYRVERALHFSNGGGVYQAVDTRSGARVVLKEARPHAGLAADGSDAVCRLQRERDMLTRLSGLTVVPGVRGYFELGGHHFLVLDYVEGRPLNSFFAERHPLLDPQPDPGRIAAYTRWALSICEATEEAVAAVHARGVVIGDLHMFNIMVLPGGGVALLDFEVAAPAGEGQRPGVGNPAFAAPRGRTGYGIDRYSLGCLRLAMFMPMTTLLSLRQDKAWHLASAIAEQFPVPREFLAEAVRDITGEPARPAPPRPRQPRLEPGAGGLRRASRALARAIAASATPQRDDRLFPGDIRQFADPGGGLCLAYGAAGVLYALAEAGQPVPAAYEEWLVTRAARPERGMRPGLYGGLLGVAWVLHRLGHPEAALKIADICLGERWRKLGSDLQDGLSGMALVLLHLGDVLREPGLSAAGEEALAIVTGRGPRRGDGTPPGLLRGAAGPALLFVRAYERTGDAGYLDLAAEALHSDLAGCVTDAAGALHVDEGWRVLPYLGHGSAGIGLVIDEYLTHRPDERLAGAAARIRLAACSPYYAQPGLFNGRAGMILHLARRQPPGAASPEVASHVRRLAWHAVGYRRGLAFPGEHLYRLSMDLATGTAGVLLSLAAAAGLTPGLPFLSPLARHCQAGAAQPPGPSGSPSAGYTAGRPDQGR